MSYGIAEELKILEHNGKYASVIVVIVFTYINTVKQNFSLGGVIQTAEKLYKGGFARAVSSYQRKLFTNAEFHIYVLKSVGVRPRILEGYVTELDFIVCIPALFRGKTTLIHFVGDIEVFKDQLYKNGIVFHISPQGNES